MTLEEMVRQIPTAVSRGLAVLVAAVSGAIPDLTVPNLPVGGAPAPTFFGAYGQWMGSAPPSWEDVAWLREQWGGAFMLKGVTRVDDAKRAVDAGVTAISVSNHGGNNLDGTPATIRLLPDIARAVGDQVEVLMDGGVRRGGDVVKALALGARAVMIGRAYLWGLGANGQAGVENVLDLMRSGIDSCLLGLGHSSISRALARGPGDTAGVHQAAWRLTPDQRNLSDCVGISLTHCYHDPRQARGHGDSGQADFVARISISGLRFHNEATAHLR